MVLRGLVNLQKHFESLHDSNDSEEKSQNAENLILKFRPSQKLCMF